MIKLEMKETDYIVSEFKKLIGDIDNIDSIENEEYIRFLGSIDQETYDDMKKVIENIDKVNVDEEINKSCINAIYWGCGMWVWLDNEEEVTEVKRLLGESEPEEYYSIYAKLAEVE